MHVLASLIAGGARMNCSCLSERGNRGRPAQIVARARVRVVQGWNAVVDGILDVMFGNTFGRLVDITYLR